MSSVWICKLFHHYSKMIVIKINLSTL